MWEEQRVLQGVTGGQFEGADVPLVLPPVTARPALAELLKAFDYARSAARDPWSFAVEISRLRELGLFESDFRWLASMGYAQHAREITQLEDDGREFRPTGKLSFCERTCFVLTDLGATFIRSFLVRGTPSESNSQTPVGVSQPQIIHAPSTNGLSVGLTPTWDHERHELRFGGQLVKRFKWPAANQETILAAFDEEGWPAHIDDPLSPQADQDPKRRLHDTIKCLNRKQINVLLHFRGDGTGEGVLWEIVEEQPK